MPVELEINELPLAHKGMTMLDSTIDSQPAENNVHLEFIMTQTVFKTLLDLVFKI